MARTSYLFFFIPFLLLVSCASAAVSVSGLPFNKLMDAGDSDTYHFYTTSSSPVTITSTSTWVTVNKPVANGKTQPNTAEVHIPASASPGDYTSYVVVTSTPTAGTVKVQEQVKMPIRVTVKGDTKPVTISPTIKPTLQAVSKDTEPKVAPQSQKAPQPEEKPTMYDGSRDVMLALGGMAGVILVIFMFSRRNG